MNLLSLILFKVIADMKVVLLFTLHSVICISAYDAPKIPIKEIGEVVVTLSADTRVRHCHMSDPPWATFCLAISGALCSD